MTAWLLSFGWNWLLVPVAIWFLNGLRKAFLNPRIKLHLMTKVKDGEYFLEVTRQELLPPWRQLRETWLLHAHPNCRNGRDGQATREDGKTAPYVPGYMTLSSSLGAALFGTLRVAKARDAETEELSK